MILAGERLPPQVVHRLAKLLPDEQLASRLVAALDTQTTIFALSESQCETMILALGESPPAPLVALRGALVKQRDLRGRRRRRSCAGVSATPKRARPRYEAAARHRRAASRAPCLPRVCCGSSSNDSATTERGPDGSTQPGLRRRLTRRPRTGRHLGLAGRGRSAVHPPSALPRRRAREFTPAPGGRGMSTGAI